MPVHYTIDKHSRLILTVAEGHVTFGEIKAHQDRLLSDADFDPAFNQMIDTTDATEVDLSPAEAKEIALRRIVSSASRRAFIAKKPHIYGIGRFMEVYHQHFAQVETHIFSERDAGLKWLGLKP